MARAARAYADGPFGQIHYADTGVADSAGAPLILLHQAPMSYRQFDSVMPLLAQRGVRAIAIDMPGFGQSDPTDFVPTITDYATVLPPVLDHLGLSSAAVLGHHTGSAVATEASLLYPDRIDRLILNGPIPFPPEQRAEWLEWVDKAERRFTAEPDGSHLSELFRNRLSFANEDTDWSLASRYIGETLSGLGPFWYGHHAAFQYDHYETLPKIAVPTLILTNTGDQIYAQAKETHALRPDFAFAEIAGGGIDIVDEKPVEWADAVAAFVLGGSR